ncbi:hypothetical protein PG997_010524 [Apiospora hydei]|uniref:Uncharacterized protein n=1 Tax=Apiospora hydei TaxID=1337664 RepID=A0ABR1VZW4_9PEZI
MFLTHRALWDWVRKRAEACNARKSENEEEGFKISLENLPGWELVSILSQLGDELGKTGKTGKLANTESSVVDLGAKLNSRLRDLFRDQSPDKEVTLPNFAGHQLLHITPVKELADDKKAMLGPENELTELFLRSLEEKYRSIEQADLLIRPDNETNETRLLYTGYDKFKNQKSVGKQAASETGEEETAGEEMHLAADRQVEFLIGAIQHDLMRQWSLIAPGKKEKTREEQELILETAWQLAQAIAYHEVRMPSLADLTAAGPTRSYWRKGSEPSDSGTDSSSVSDFSLDL